MDFISGFWKVSARAREILSNKEEGGASAAAAAQEDGEERIKENLLPENGGEIQKPASSLSLETQQGGSEASSPESEGPDSVRSSSPSSGDTGRIKEGGTGEAENLDPDAQGAAGAGIAGDLKDVSHKAVESAKSIGSFLFGVASKASRTVSETAKHLKHTVEENSILADFNKEQEAFVNSKNSKSKDGGIAPWLGCEDEEAVKQQIISLSTDKRNFLRSPPTGVQFPFIFDDMYPVAMLMLQEDPQLEKIRFELVPKLINEENFWRNYFYRVSLVKQSTQLSSLAHQKSSSGDSSSWSSRKSSSDESVKAVKQQSVPEEGGDEGDGITDSPTHEFVSDAYQGNQLSEEDIKQGMKQLGVSGRASKEEEWERELQQELQEYEVVADEANTVDDPEWENEIEQMLEDEKRKDPV